MIDEEDEDIAEDDEEIEENMEDIDNREEDDSSIDNTNALISEESPVKFDRNKINLKISFLLQQQNMTLEEISHLHTGSLVPLLPEAEKKIIVTVNNQRYAKGELIQIGDQLAVEITEIYFEKDK